MITGQASFATWDDPLTHRDGRSWSTWPWGTEPESVLVQMKQESEDE